MVTKKKAAKKKCTKILKIIAWAKKLKFDKKIIPIILGSISALGALLVPSLFSLFGIAGLIVSYNQKKEKPNKLNKWGFYLSISGIILSVIFMTLALFYMASVIQQPQY